MAHLMSIATLARHSRTYRSTTCRPQVVVPGMSSLVPDWMDEECHHFFICGAILRNLAKICRNL